MFDITTARVSRLLTPQLKEALHPPRYYCRIEDERNEKEQVEQKCSVDVLFYFKLLSIRVGNQSVSFSHTRRFMNCTPA